MTRINQMSERRLRPLIGNLRYRFERQIALENCGNLHPAPFASEKKVKSFLRFVTSVII